MRAAAIVVQALIGTAFPKRLIGPIPAITPLVAHLLHANTFPTAALKPGWALAMRGINTTSFIAHVPAVILMVALAAAMDAGAITAFKLIRTTGGSSTVSFIRSIVTVSSSITLPATMDALSAATAELQG